MAVLGRLPKSRSFRNIKRFDLAKQIEQAIILRYDDQFVFLPIPAIF